MSDHTVPQPTSNGTSHFTEAVSKVLVKYDPTEQQTAAVEHATIERLPSLAPGYPNRAEWDAALIQRSASPFPVDASQHLLPAMDNLWLKLQEPNGELLEDISEPAIMQRLAPLLNLGEQFTAGQLHTRAAVWQRYLQLANVATEHAVTIMDWLKNGVPLMPTAAEDPQKQREPRHQHKVEAVRRILLRNGVPYTTVEDMLKGEAIEPVVMKNTISNPDDRQFMRAEIAKGVASGALKVWPFTDSRPAVVQSLFVVVNPYNKKRQVVNAIHTNLHLQYKPVKYQTIKDAARMLSGMKYAYALDFRSGYHHLLLRPEVWTYFGVQFEGKVYVHVALPFGLSQAPEMFTRVVETIYRPLRQMGWPLTSMVDDALGAGHSATNCAWRLLHHVTPVVPV